MNESNICERKIPSSNSPLFKYIRSFSGKAKGNCQGNKLLKIQNLNNSRKQPLLFSKSMLFFTTYVWQISDKKSICSFLSNETQTVFVVQKRMKTCSVDFNNKDLDISFFVFKPTVVIVEHLVHGLQHFSLLTQNLGCVQSSIFRSIHGNMVTSSFLSLILYFLNSLYFVLSFLFWIL